MHTHNTIHCHAALLYRVTAIHFFSIYFVFNEIYFSTSHCSMTLCVTILNWISSDHQHIATVSFSSFPWSKGL